MDDITDKNSMQRLVHGNYNSEIPETHPSKIIKRFTLDNLVKIDNTEYDKFHEQKYEEFKKQNEDLQRIDDNIISLLENRLSYPDNKLRKKIQKLLDNEELSPKDKSYNGFEEYEEVDEKILEIIQRRLESRDTNIRTKIQDLIDSPEEDTSDESDSSNYKILEILESRLLYEDHGIKNKINKLLNNEELNHEDSDYEGFEEYEAMDNAILYMIREELRSNDEKIRESIRKIITDHDMSEQQDASSIIPRDLEKSSIIALLIYCQINGITNYEKMSEKCESDEYCKYIMDGLIPSEATIQEVVRDYGYIFELINASFQTTFKDNKLNAFNPIMLNVRIHCNDNYIIDSKDIKKLAKDLPKIDKKRIKKLNNTLSAAAYAILTTTNLTKNEKLDYVRFLKKQLKDAKKKKLKLNTDDVTYLLGNKKQIEINYKQKSYDKPSNMITKISIAPKSVDIADYTEETVTQDLKMYDTIDFKQYLTDKSRTIEEITSNGYDESKSYLEYLDENKSEDFKYDFKSDTIKCPKSNELHLEETIIDKSKTIKKPDMIRRRYSNPYCNNCDLQDECNKKSIREIIMFNNNLKKQSSIPSEDIIETENSIYLSIVAYNLQRQMNARNNIQEKEDVFESFISQLEDRFEDFDFEITVCD